MIAWSSGLAVLGAILAFSWHHIIRSAFYSSGAEIVITDPSAIFIDQIIVVLLTAALGTLAGLIAAIAERAAGQSVWPAWSLIFILLIGENLAIGLRMVALATLSLPHTVAMAAATKTTPTLDLNDALLAIWAVGGIAGAAAVSLGLLITVGLLQAPDTDTTSDG